MKKPLPPPEDRIVAFPPEIIGEPRQDLCEACEDEPAEYRVITYGCQSGGAQGDPGSGASVDDLCGTCLAWEQKKATLTVAEAYDMGMI